MKRFVFLLLLVATMTAAAQDDRPGWLSNKPKAGNSTYLYVMERGSGRSVNEATTNAIIKVMRTTMMRLGGSGYDEMVTLLQQGADWESVAMRYGVPINKVCEYVERRSDKGFLVAVLCQVAKSGNVYPEFDDFTGCGDTKSYNDMEAALKSALLPGLGQIGKNQKVEGIITMSAEAALITSAAVFYFIGETQLQEMYNTGISLNHFAEYAEGYKTYRNTHITFVSAAAALYVFNIVRAYTMAPRYKTDGIVIAPALMPTDHSLAAGLGLTFNF